MDSPEVFTGSAAVMWALAAASAVTSVVGGIAESKAQKQNALFAESEAEQALLTGQAEASRTKRENDQRLSMIRADLGAQGTTMEGSPMLAYLDSVKNAELQRQDALYAGQLKYRSKGMEADIYRRQAGGAIFGGVAKGLGSFASLGSSLLK